MILIDAKNAILKKTTTQYVLKKKRSHKFLTLKRLGKKKVKIDTFALTITVILACCPGCIRQYEMGTYAYDRAYLSKH